MGGGQGVCVIKAGCNEECRKATHDSGLPFSPLLPSLTVAPTNRIKRIGKEFSFSQIRWSSG